MKKMIMIVVLALGSLTWRMGAMEAQAEAEAGDVMLQTNDGQLVSISRKDARCFPTIIDAVSILSTDEPIPVNVMQPVLQRLLQDLDWVRAVCNERRPDETEQQCAERAARALPPSAYVYSDNSMRITFENLAAAHYLGSLELQERYARILAGMLVSDQSLALLYSNNPAHIAFIQKIEPLRGDGDQKVYAENRNAGPLNVFAKLIYKYFSHGEVWERRVFFRAHTNKIYSLSFSLDGARVVTASGDRTAKIWDANSGALLHTLQGPHGHTDFVYSASFSPNGDRVVTASRDRMAKIWDANSGALLHTLQGHTNLIVSASFSPDGSRVVTASSDRTAKIWDANSGALLCTLQGHRHEVRPASFSSDGTRVVTASGDRTAKIWDANSGALLHTLQGHTDLVYSASFSPNGDRVVTASGDRTAKIWDANSGALLHTLQGPQGHTDLIYSASFSPNGDRVVTASRDRMAKIWDANSGVLVHTLQGHTNLIVSATFSPDGSRVVTVSSDGTARIWNANSGELLDTLQGNVASFSPDGTRVATASNDGMVRIWRSIPTDSFDRALFICMLRWAQRNNKPVGWQTEWGRMVMDTYNPDVEAMIKQAFPKSLTEKLKEKVGELFK